MIHLCNGQGPHSATQIAAVATLEHFDMHPDDALRRWLEVASNSFPSIALVAISLGRVRIPLRGQLLGRVYDPASDTGFVLFLIQRASGVQVECAQIESEEPDRPEEETARFGIRGYWLHPAELQ